MVILNIGNLVKRPKGDVTDTVMIIFLKIGFCLPEIFQKKHKVTTGIITTLVCSELKAYFVIDVITNLHSYCRSLSFIAWYYCL